MIWLNPLAWFGVAAIAVPIIVHLVAHRRAERITFPTLRFLQPTRLTAIRRRTLEDLALLVLRCAIVAAAVAACAGPLLVTPARRALWNGRLVRAVVVSGAAPRESSSVTAAFRVEQFETGAVSEGIHRAVAWLESAPPARRELVVAAPLTIGSIGDADLAGVPTDVGIRFMRTADVPAARTVDDSPLLTRTGARRRSVVLTGPATSVREAGDTVPAAWPIEVIAPSDLQRTVDAARDAVLSLRVRAPAADRRAQLVFAQGSDVRVAGDVAAIRTPWMADSLARVARDTDLQSEAARVPAGLVDPRFARGPWHVLVNALDGRPIASAAMASHKLTVVAAARAGDLIVPVLMRAIANGLAPASDLTAADVLPIGDATLRAWTRPPGPPPPPRPETVDRDDRRWLWGVVLLLLMVENWVRRSARGADHVQEEVRARVA